MLKFSEFAYKRPDMKILENKFDNLLDAFEKSQSPEEQISIIKDIDELRSKFDTMENLMYIRYTINTTDNFYKNEKDFFDNNKPVYEGITFKYTKALVGSKFRRFLEEKLGSQLFTLAELQLKTFSPEVIEDLIEENKVSTEYTDLIASARILFEGEERNLSQMVPFQQSKDRNMRKAAYEARFNFFKENEDKFDRIYDDLVKVRTRIAKKLGFTNFVELAYARLGRSDYNSDMVAAFRRQVLEYIVPASSRLKERQKKRLGLDSLKYYDDKFNYKGGNATPKGDAVRLVDSAKSMYSELSSETGKFFDFMTSLELLDLLSKKGKAGGGYCTYLTEYKAPFIFANFNGTSHDVNVLTHEAGHAFAAHCTKDIEIPEYHFPTLETCEIHSMSMEFFTWPWMELFFKEDTDKYKFSHVEDAVNFIPYGVTVDEFQHFVYENPEATPAERKRMWREIEKKYLPYVDYDSNDYLERGGFWYQQSHIFEVPFYYIDYTLAQICALQFWKKSNNDRESAWGDYVSLCKAGGSMPYLDLLKLAHLVPPFNDSCIRDIIGDIETWLNSIDDSKL